MVQRTTADEKLPRSELAAFLATLSEEFDGESEQINVDVGNKTVSLNPSEEVDFSIDVVERSSMLRGSRETIEIELSWKS
ncbi:amphi-Trp domain-containing protein [Haloterrigena sp. SYSU A558-1]|uniref:Amphi-Trp domain-containing protein n=1 Tax=Haloterrigena gelatinilytica TaxID=2741724 RepID=A0A8J8GLG6_9EURY|nr:amphi-Trp domain-containing protein [Haloterrigena gelatinilytica]NUB90609.1 amphi-Trp domain-containing protein [Haloterrigena gelatinilytica]NUC73572.1 amphi-Trp domain-containing protein [Haloterrigena gelatinilytica]